VSSKQVAEQEDNGHDGEVADDQAGEKDKDGYGSLGGERGVMDVTPGFGI
jgi:hypothetical protein